MATRTALPSRLFGRRFLLSVGGTLVVSDGTDAVGSVLVDDFVRTRDWTRVWRDGIYDMPEAILQLASLVGNPPTLSPNPTIHVVKDAIVAIMDMFDAYRKPLQWGFKRFEVARPAAPHSDATQKHSAVKQTLVYRHMATCMFPQLFSASSLTNVSLGKVKKTSIQNVVAFIGINTDISSKNLHKHIAFIRRQQIDAPVQEVQCRCWQAYCVPVWLR